MKPRGRALVLPPEYRALEDAYATDLERLGFQVNSTWRWGARAFCVRFGDGAGWHALSLMDQLALNRKLQRFITWLMLTRRLRPSADYLVARRHELGPLLARMDPLSHATFAATALEIGFSSHAIQYQWAALAHVCAFCGIRPQEVQHAHIDATRSAFTQAAARQGRGSMQFFHSSIFGLEATLFHAGVTAELPRRQSPTKAAQRAAAWDALASGAPTLVATVQRYLEQLALSLRPGTVRTSEGTLYEVIGFLATQDPSVTCAADIGRRHVEAYKAWLAQHRSARGAPLHRHTIGERLGRLRAFFQRIIEWGYEDAPARVPLFAGDFPSGISRCPDSSMTERLPGYWWRLALTRTHSSDSRSSSWHAPVCARVSSWI